MLRRVVTGLLLSTSRISIAVATRPRYDPFPPSSYFLRMMLSIAVATRPRYDPFLPSSYFLRLHYPGTIVYATFARELRVSKQHNNHANAENAGNMNANRNVSASVKLPHQETYKPLVRQVTAEDQEMMKKRLLSTGKHCMALEEVLGLVICEKMCNATTQDEARELLESLEDAGALLTLRNQVFLQPEKVARVLSMAMPLLLREENDISSQEYAKLQNERKKIIQITQKQVQRILWIAFSALLAHSMWFLRLSFYDYSWDVMEPISYFISSGSLLAGLLFLFTTKKDPSYQNIRHMLLSFKQHKLLSKRNFDTKRFEELERQHFLPREIN